ADHRAERARPAPGRGPRQHRALRLRGRCRGADRGPRRHLRSPAPGFLPALLRFPRVVLMIVVTGTASPARIVGGLRKMAVAALALLPFVLPLAAPVAAQKALPSARVKDVGRIVGVRENELYGYGIVIGLNGTGDRRQSSFFTV